MLHRPKQKMLEFNQNLRLRTESRKVTQKPKAVQSSLKLISRDSHLQKIRKYVKQSHLVKSRM